jgi:hypothetical protein
MPTSPTSAPAAGAGCSGSPAPTADDKICHCPARPRPGSTPTSPAGSARPAIKRYSLPGPAGGYSPLTCAGPSAASPPRPACPPTRLATWDRGRSASSLPRCIFRPGHPQAPTASRRMPPHAPSSDPARPGIQIHHCGPVAGLTAAPATLNTPPGIPGRAYPPPHLSAISRPTNVAGPPPWGKHLGQLLCACGERKLPPGQKNRSSVGRRRPSVSICPVDRPG